MVAPSPQDRAVGLQLRLGIQTQWGTLCTPSDRSRLRKSRSGTRCTKWHCHRVGNAPRNMPNTTCSPSRFENTHAGRRRKTWHHLHPTSARISQNATSTLSETGWTVGRRGACTKCEHLESYRPGSSQRCKPGAAGNFQSMRNRGRNECTLTMHRGLKTTLESMPHR